MRNLKGIETIEISRSADGYPIFAYVFGKHEVLKEKTSESLSSAIAGGSPSAFYGKGKKKRQSFVFLGAAHGIEIEGSVAALNLLNIALTGKDLRGKKWPVLFELCKQLRLVIIPFFNIEGRQRFNWCKHTIGIDNPEYNVRIALGITKDGETFTWPEFKKYWPVPVNNMKILGSTFNNKGYNLVYDHGFNGKFQPETAGLIRFLKTEMPDCVLCSHSNTGSLVEAPSKFIPERFKHRIVQMIGTVSRRCIKEGFEVNTLIEAADVPDYCKNFYQTDLIYHCCGALPVIVEFPRGIKRAESFDQILDIGLCVFEEILFLGVKKGFIPEWPQDINKI